MGKLLFVVIFMAFAVNLFAEEVTITTYYPAPEGVYHTIIADEIGIGTPDPDAIFEVNSTSDGILIPRMIKADRDLIYLPPTSLLIYQTDDQPNNPHGYYYYDFSIPGWVQLLDSGGGGGWWDSDNDIDIYNTNTGNVGIGITAPSNRLQVNLSSDTEHGVRVSDGTNNSNIVIQPLTGSRSGYQRISFNGYYDEAAGGEKMYNTSKKHWKLGVNQMGSNDYFFITNNGWGGATFKNVFFASPDGDAFAFGMSSPTVLATKGLLFKGALARGDSGNNLYGPVYTPTHINLGVDSTTGEDGYDFSYCTVSGGYDNFAGGTYTSPVNFFGYSTVAGGLSNEASAGYSTVSGGNTNIASGLESTVAGGLSNTASGLLSVVSGGERNTASSMYSAVPGGLRNEALGHNSFAAGTDARVKSDHYGSFVWSDDSNPGTYYESHGINTFNIKATGGAWLDGANTWQDVAELMNFSKKENIEEAELISFTGNDLLGKSNSAYDENLAGVISSTKTMTLRLGTTSPPANGIKRHYVSLVGRCFVKVCDEAGSIRVGDPITSSSQPGVGMKATRSGKIVGYAMQEEDFKDKDTSEILVFVNLGYYQNREEYNNLVKKVQLLEETLRSR